MMLASLWNLSPLAWSAIASWVGITIAFGAACVAWRQVKEARRLRDERSQPYVVAYLDPIEASPKSIDLVIKNFGLTAATDVRVKFCVPLESAVLGSPISTPKTIPVLVPGQEWRTFWDATHARGANRELPRLYTAQVAFNDSRRKKTFQFQFDLDWNVLIERGYVTVYTIHDAAEALSTISKALTTATSAHGAMNVRARIVGGPPTPVEDEHISGHDSAQVKGDSVE